MRTLFMGGVFKRAFVLASTTLAPLVRGSAISRSVPLVAMVRMPKATAWHPLMQITIRVTLTAWTISQEFCDAGIIESVFV